ncbi:hypothetical protein M407DRAFT_240798 [Tulasnella calospora MUT 4182]|uniref:Uncharacterized protein n=1 Tax=Tulasnella calospora MUT 4182 TaxID=1051891 RepID=A0A0C3LJG8_9AGAM|nr:hypothetical protein M407DRAFT_240798 [Tulasnella calospora MUT 4182]
MESREQLISMLRSRYGQANSEGEPGLRRPTSLRSVELRGRMRTQGLVEEIMEILGEARVFWANE